MSSNDHDKIALAREYFIRADQGRPDILELFHEDAEIYFPKFGFGFGRQSLFEMVKGFDGSLEYIRHDYDSLTFIPSGSSVNAFDDERVAGAIAATGRKKLIFAGISLEVCAAFPAITAIGKGLGAYVAVDASGTFSETKRLVGLLRMLQAGVIVSDYGTLMVEILRDNARPEAGAVYGAIDMPWAKLVGQIAQAYRK